MHGVVIWEKTSCETIYIYLMNLCEWNRVPRILGKMKEPKLSTITGSGLDTVGDGGGLSQHPFQGVCQGNGAGLDIWLALSLFLIYMIHQSGSPNQISSAVSLTSIAMVCFIYIDDCDLFVLPPSDLSPQGVLHTLQHNLDIWQGGVEATSGVLSLDKCSWSGLFYFFKAGQWKLHSLQSYPAILTI